MNEIFLKVNQDVLVSELQQVRPDMLLVLAYFSMFCWKNRLQCVVTSVFEEVVERASDTHKEGRGVDVSVRGFGPKDISDCIDYLNENVGHLWRSLVRRASMEQHSRTARAKQIHHSNP